MKYILILKAYFKFVLHSATTTKPMFSDLLQCYDIEIFATLFDLIVSRNRRTLHAK